MVCIARSGTISQDDGKGDGGEGDSIGLYYSLIWYRVELEIWPLKDFIAVVLFL